MSAKKTTVEDLNPVRSVRFEREEYDRFIDAIGGFPFQDAVRRLVAFFMALDDKSQVQLLMRGNDAAVRSIIEHAQNTAVEPPARTKSRTA